MLNNEKKKKNRCFFRNCWFVYMIHIIYLFDYFIMYFSCSAVIMTDL